MQSYFHALSDVAQAALTGDEVAPPTLDQWIDAAQGILDLAAAGRGVFLQQCCGCDQHSGRANSSRISFRSYQAGGDVSARIATLYLNPRGFQACENTLNGRPDRARACEAAFPLLKFLEDSG